MGSENWKTSKTTLEALITILTCLLECNWPQVTLQNNFLAFTLKSGKQLPPFSILSWLTKVSTLK